MNKIKYFIIILSVIFLSSCSVDYIENPNEPVLVPTSGLMNRVQKQLMSDTRDEWFSGRQALLWVQYWNQVNYTEEDRFQYRESVNKSSWNYLYAIAQDLVSIITLNTDESTKDEMSQYGPNENQIAAARIMLVYIYDLATEIWGDVPYYSYGNDDADFQANSLSSDDVNSPKYASQEKIFADMLKELDEAQDMIDVTATMIDADNFFDGNASQWKKFANSLRLRIANRIKDVYPDASTHIADAINDGVMDSNSDNAGVTFEDDATNAAPMYIAFYVDQRADFSPSMQFVELLQGKRGNFSADPRLDIYVADNKDGNKVGIPLTNSNGVVSKFTKESLPGEAILASTYTEYYMEYSEVCFLLSEVNGWDQDWYEKGVRASMEKWGVTSEDIDSYISTLPAASEENVITQKYIALYMQPNEAWSEYRRTGYPNTFVKPGETYDYTYPIDSKGNTETTTYTFETIGGLTDVPNRNAYLLNEYSVNEANVTDASTSIGGDKKVTKLWWQE